MTPAEVAFTVVIAVGFVILAGFAGWVIGAFASCELCKADRTFIRRIVKERNALRDELAARKASS